MAVDRNSRLATASLMILAVLGVLASIYLMRVILVPIALALVLACVLSPITTLLRRLLPIGPTGAAVVLFLGTTVVGLYAASLTAESLIQATTTLPGDLQAVSSKLSSHISGVVKEHPSLRTILPDPGTIDELGDANSRLLISNLSYGLTDLMGWLAQGLVILVLVLFLLAESEMLTPKLIRFFASSPGEARVAERELKALTRQIRSYLAARTVINLGMGTVVALALWGRGVRFPFALGLLAAITNFVPYVGQVIGGAVPTIIALGQNGSIADALIVASLYLAILGVEGYVVTPWVMGRSLDLNGTTVLIACLFWGYLWGLVGLILAMPITVSLKLVFQNVPELYRWAELMSVDWHPPEEPTEIKEPDEVEAGEVRLSRGLFGVEEEMSA